MHDSKDPFLPTAASGVPPRRDPRLPQADPPAEPTLADLLAAVQGSTAAAARADNLALAAEIDMLKCQLAERKTKASGLAPYQDVHEIGRAHV